MPPRRSNRERPVKIDMSFPDAIRFFATPPGERSGQSRRTGSEAEASGSTMPAVPGPDPAGPETADRRTLFDFPPENQTQPDTSADGGR